MIPMVMVSMMQVLMTMIIEIKHAMKDMNLLFSHM